LVGKRWQTQLQRPAAPARTVLLQRRCACGGSSSTLGECTECRHNRLALQRGATDRAELAAVPAIVREVLHSPGQPLDPATRAFMEARLGHDFSRVRIHADARAAESAHAVHAQAYTVGQDIVFGIGELAPQRPEGRHLLAHELVHTIQQATGLVATSSPSAEGLTVSSPTDRAERDADQAADRALAGSTVAPPTLPQVGGPLMQRQPLSGFPDVTLRPPPLTARLLGSGTLDGFALNSAALTSEHKTHLTALAISLKDLLRGYPGGSVQITGHTDATGDESLNTPLGQQRADAVQQFLVDAGVPPGVITATSAGESQLRVPTNKAEPRNRRVEVHFEPESRVKLVLPLEMPSPLPPAKEVEPEYKGPPPMPPTPDLRNICVVYPPACRPPDGTELPPDFWKPLPPAPKGTEPKSVLDRIFEKIVDPIVDGITGWLPKGVQDKIRDLAHDAVEKGITTGLEEALNESNLSPQEQQAILKAVEAAIKQKGKPNP
jgi:outer membrane protein OmpA-like peptidoglycan-associated protein